MRLQRLFRSFESERAWRLWRHRLLQYDTGRSFLSVVPAGTEAQSGRHHFRIGVIPSVRMSSTSGSQKATLTS